MRAGDGPDGAAVPASLQLLWPARDADVPRHGAGAVFVFIFVLVVVLSFTLVFVSVLFHGHFVYNFISNLISLDCLFFPM